MLVCAFLLGGFSIGTAAERQLTVDTEYDHHLDNNDNFSPDDRFLVFDTRPANRTAESRLIAKVDVSSGKIIPLYSPAKPNQFGPGVLAASYAPDRDEVIFIHGPMHPQGEADRYEKHRRVGAIVSGSGTGALRFSDARNVTAPYTPGALRGGTHRHEYSGDGKWIGFTYNDEVYRAHGLQLGKNLDLRTIGVTKLGTKVTVPPSSQFPTMGEGFSVLVVKVSPHPAPGSDEISQATADSWIGLQGYLRPDGSRQRSRAFIGTTRDSQNQSVEELFVVDIPEEISNPGPEGPLEGTSSTLPMPPRGTRQRRLTHTEGTSFPGCQGVARSSPDGRWISFRHRDSQGHWQIFLISPLGGTPQQLTREPNGIESDARWHPSGTSVAVVSGERILVIDTQEGPRWGTSRVLVESGPLPFALVWSHSGKTLAFNRRLHIPNREVVQIFTVNFAP